MQYFDSKLVAACSSFVGNKINGDGISLADKFIDEEMYPIVLDRIIASIDEENMEYRFVNPECNLIKCVCGELFSSNNVESMFLNSSANMARHLYDSTGLYSTGSNVIFAYVKDIFYSGEMVDAVAVVKDVYYNTNRSLIVSNHSLSAEYEVARVKDPSIAALILNTRKDDGLRILCSKESRKSRTSTWFIDEFLNAELVHNDYVMYRRLIESTRNFIECGIEDEYEITEIQKLEKMHELISLADDPEVLQLSVDTIADELFRDDNPDLAELFVRKMEALGIDRNYWLPARKDILRSIKNIKMKVGDNVIRIKDVSKIKDVDGGILIVR